ncbi:unnamed protein product [Pedinophyceae sp. YPF-701]|nr:unnamed protein product [Pedinophyceae sp. YPF-701]
MGDRSSADPAKAVRGSGGFADAAGGAVELAPATATDKDLSEVKVSSEHTSWGDLMEQLEAMADGQLRLKVRDIVPKWWRVAHPWFAGDERWRARAWAASTVAMSLVTTWLLVRISYAQKDFATALAGKDADGFYRAVWAFVEIIAIATVLFAASSWVESRLKVEWRDWLTRTLLAKYYSSRAYYRLQQSHVQLLDNPDQRICDDVARFTVTTATLAVTLLGKVFNSLAFAGVLWSISPKLVVFLVTYAVAGTAVTSFGFGRQLMRLHFRMLQAEGDLRFGLVRTRENAESIAFYRGEGEQRDSALRNLGHLIDVMRRRIAWFAGLNLWTNAYTYATILLPSLLTAPRYFDGEIEYGVISQTSYAFARINDAVSILIANFSEFAGLAAETQRLDALMRALDCKDLPGGRTEILRADDGASAGSEMLAIRALHLTTPRGEAVLCRELSLSLARGESLLIVGPNGAGKSSILRAAAGLWTHGKGLIRIPGGSRVFFLPQRPFMPLGSLRHQVAFPSRPTGGERASTLTKDSEVDALLGGDAGKPRHAADTGDEALLSALRVCRMPDLADRHGGLGAEQDWSGLLSLGEQQRVAFARLLVHGPDMAFLDEATSAMDVETEAGLYEELRRRCPCFVSVGHRAQLVQYHTWVLVARGAGEWELLPREKYKPREQEVVH